MGTPLKHESIFVSKVQDFNIKCQEKLSCEIEDEYINQNSIENMENDYEKNLESSIIYKKLGNPFERKNIIFPIKAVYNETREKITLDELKSRSWMLRDAQQELNMSKGQKGVF